MRNAFTASNLRRLAQLLALATVCSAVVAQPERPPKVHDLGRVEPGKGEPERAEVADTRPQPPRRSATKALQLAGATGDDSPVLARISPRGLYHPMVSAYLRCAKAYSWTMTTVNNNLWRCDASAGPDTFMHFEFRQLKPNAKYLVTVNHRIGKLDIRTTVGESIQTTTIENPGEPLYLVFATGAGQSEASIQLLNMHGPSGHPLSTTTFYWLELNEIR
jgi:hypothetical protein